MSFLIAGVTNKVFLSVLVQRKIPLHLVLAKIKIYSKQEFKNYKSCDIRKFCSKQNNVKNYSAMVSLTCKYFCVLY